MANSVPSSPSPVSFTFPPLIHEPVKPNPHPYAIRTTSTGVLSRSNSSGRNPASRHHYVPLAPSATKRDGRVHRSVKSTSSISSLDLPQPPPVPPELAQGVRQHRRIRADTLPATVTEYEPLNISLAPVALPANPKLWTVAQLSSYLLRTLRIPSRSSDVEDELLATVQDVAAIVKEAEINGRAFLRLDEADLNSIGINQRWCEVLLHASRALRQSAIKAQIWGPDPESSPPSGSASPALPSHPFTNAQFSSSSSSLDLSSDEGAADARRRRRHRGRVLGMVESFERSGSFSSESSCDEDVIGDREPYEHWLPDEPHSSVETQMVSPTSEAPTNSPTLPICKDALCTAEPEEPSIETLLAHDPKERSTTAADHTYSWGARAWEDLDIAPGITVKHIPDHVAAHPPLQPAQPVRQEHPQEATDAPPGTGGSAKTSTRGRARDERRVVTAIFAPRTLAKPSAENQHDPAAAIERLGPVASSEEAIQTASEETTVEGVREASLQAELAATRALVEGLRVRLEGVEQKLTELQDKEARREMRLYEERAVDTDVTETNTPQGVEASTITPPPLTDPREAVQDPSVPEPQLTHIAPPAGASQTHASTVSSIIQASTNRKLNDDHEVPGQVPDEPALSDLPQYVFLVGVGVCAVVLQVALRKFFGRSVWK